MDGVIIKPIATEKTMLHLEKENKISFIVNKKSTKQDIKKEVEERFQVKVTDVNVLITRKGKRAVVTLSKEFSADEIAGRIGIF